MNQTTEHRQLTQADLLAEARARFGDDPKLWAFVCPACSDVATSGDFPEGSAQLGQYCVGNFVPNRGCDWKSFGLIGGPWEILMPTGRSVFGFALAGVPAGHGDAER